MGRGCRWGRRSRPDGGAGWLASQVLGGPTYPQVSAEQSLSTVRQGPGLPREIVGARPGLMLRRELSERELLVPAWFYDPRGGSSLIAVAVDPAYVRER